MMDQKQSQSNEANNPQTIEEEKQFYNNTNWNQQTPNQAVQNIFQLKAWENNQTNSNKPQNCENEMGQNLEGGESSLQAQNTSHYYSKYSQELQNLDYNSQNQTNRGLKRRSTSRGYASDK